MKHHGSHLPFFAGLFLILSMSGQGSLCAQNQELDSLNRLISTYEGEDEGLINALARVSYLHNAINPKEGISLGKKALSLSSKINYIDGKARSHNAIGVNFYALSDYELAVAHYDSAVHFKELDGDKRGAMITTVNIGIIEAELKNHNSALKRYEAAYTYFEEIGNEGLMGAVLVNMAIVHRSMYATTEALRVYILAMELAEKSGNKSALATALSNLGSIYLELDDVDASLNARKRGLALARAVGNRRLESRLLNGIGESYLRQSNYDSALFYRQSAYDVAKEVGVKNNQAAALTGMASVYRGKGQYTRALDLYKQALQIRKTLSTASAQSSLYLNLGRTYKSMGRLADALESFSHSLNIARQRNEMQNLRNSSRAIAEYYEERGDIDSAYRYFKIADAIGDSIDNNRDLTELSALATRYQAEKENQALLLARAEEEAALQARLEAERGVRNLIILGLVTVMILALIYYRFYKLKTKANELLATQNAIISEQKDSLSLQAEKLQVVNSHLEMLSEFRSGLTQMIAHDMKNPLNAIIGLSGRGQPSEHHAKKIAESGYQMLNLVTNMLEVEKLEEARVEPDLQEVYVDELIKTAKSQVEVLLQAKSIFFQSLIPKQICMLADPDIMVRVFVNLFTNAIKYSDNGGNVKVRHQILEEGLLRIMVEDEGPGIPDERLPYIFDKFWQSDQKKSGLAVSTGLGLTFCKLAIEAHKGKIWAESTVGEGSRFCFEMKLSKEACAQFINLESHEEANPGNLIHNGELEQLAVFSSQLKKHQVHEVGAIAKLIREMENQNISSQWKTDLQAAVYDGNQNRYDELIEMLQAE